MYFVIPSEDWATLRNGVTLTYKNNKNVNYP